MTNQPVIERMTEADLFEVIGLEEAIFTESDRWSQAMILEELTRPDRLYVGAYVENELVGYAGVRVGIDTDLMTIGVLPDWQRMGLAGALMEEISEWLARARIVGRNIYYPADETWQPPTKQGEIAPAVRRVEAIYLEVRESNHPAIAFYEKLGFEAVNRIKDYYHRPKEDALMMKRAL